MLFWVVPGVPSFVWVGAVSCGRPTTGTHRIIGVCIPCSIISRRVQYSTLRYDKQKNPQIMTVLSAAAATRENNENTLGSPHTTLQQQQQQQQPEGEAKNSSESSVPSRNAASFASEAAVTRSTSTMTSDATCSPSITNPAMTTTTTTLVNTATSNLPHSLSLGSEATLGTTSVAAVWSSNSAEDGNPWPQQQHFPLTEHSLNTSKTTTATASAMAPQQQQQQHVLDVGHNRDDDDHGTTAASSSSPVTIVGSRRAKHLVAEEDFVTNAPTTAAALATTYYQHEEASTPTETTTTTNADVPQCFTNATPALVTNAAADVPHEDKDDATSTLLQLIRKQYISAQSF